MRHVILISGKDSLATAIVQIAREPHLPYELVHNDVGWDLPETLEWIVRVGEHFGREITRCGDHLTEITREQRVLPIYGRRFCTRLGKIAPLENYLKSSPAVVYYGLRADEPERVGYVPTEGNKAITPRFPLREMNLGIGEVWGICERDGLLPPQFHWEWMEQRVRKILGPDVWLLDELPVWERNSLLAWRSRSNCDRCWYQRRYEMVGLWEHHPERWKDTCELEAEMSYSDGSFAWIRGVPWKSIPERAAAIKEKRAKTIVKFLRTKQVRSLFEDEDGEQPDELAATSCGLLCGK